MPCCATEHRSRSMTDFKTNITVPNNARESEDWLVYHGNALNERFSLKSYKLMNHLLMNINVAEEALENIQARMHMISVDTDLFFPASEMECVLKT